MYEVITSTSSLETHGSVPYLLVAILYQGNHQRKHKLQKFTKEQRKRVCSVLRLQRSYVGKRQHVLVSNDLSGVFINYVTLKYSSDCTSGEKIKEKQYTFVTFVFVVVGALSMFYSGSCYSIFHSIVS